MSRPSLQRLGVGFAVEEVRGLELPMNVTDLDVDLDEEVQVDTDPQTGGTTYEVAKRLRMSLPDLVEALVARGLPFADDALDAGTEDSLRRLLGVAPTPGRPPGPPVPVGGPGSDAPHVPEAVRIAARIMGKLLRAHVIGGKHTRIENVYGHHFSDTEKDSAREVTHKLLRLGLLFEKLNMGSRHVSIHPRRIEDTRLLAEGRCGDRAILDVLTAD